MASHDLKSYVASHLDYLDLWNAVMSLMTPSVSIDANTIADGKT